jgi:hypothetical protein
MEPALGISRCPLVQLALEVKYPLPRHQRLRERSAHVHRRPPPVQSCCVLTGPLRHVPGFPRPGLLRVLRHAPTATADGAPAPSPKARRAPPGRFPRSPSTSRQGRRPAVPRRHRRALPQHGTRPRPPEQETVGRDDPEQQPGSSTPTAHSRQFRGCCPVSGLLTLVRLLRLSALLPHPARWRRTVARSSGAAPALHHTSGIRLPLSFTQPSRRPRAGSLTPPGHMAPRGAATHRTKTTSRSRPRPRRSPYPPRAAGSDRPATARGHESCKHRADGKQQRPPSPSSLLLVSSRGDEPGDLCRCRKSGEAAALAGHWRREHRALRPPPRPPVGFRVRGRR